MEPDSTKIITSASSVQKYHGSIDYSPLEESISGPLELSPVQITPMNFLKNIKDISDNLSGKYTAFSFTPKLLLIGTDLGEIMQLELPSKKVKYFELDGIVLTIDCNYSSKIWAAGTDLGVVFIKKTHSRFSKRTLNDFGDGHEIRQIRFYKENAVVINTIEKVEIIFLRDLKLGFDCRRYPIVENGKVHYTRLNKQDEGIAMLNSIRSPILDQESRKPRRVIDKNLMRDVIQILTMPIRNNKDETLLIIATLDLIKFIIVVGHGDDFIEASTIMRPDSVERG